MKTIQGTLQFEADVTIDLSDEEWKHWKGANRFHKQELLTRWIESGRLPIDISLTSHRLTEVQGEPAMHT